MNKNSIEEKWLNTTLNYLAIFCDLITKSRNTIIFSNPQNIKIKFTDKKKITINVLVYFTRKNLTFLVETWKFQINFNDNKNNNLKYINLEYLKKKFLTLKRTINLLIKILPLNQFKNNNLINFDFSFITNILTDDNDLSKIESSNVKTLNLFPINDKIGNLEIEIKYVYRNEIFKIEDNLNNNTINNFFQKKSNNMNDDIENEIDKNKNYVLDREKKIVKNIIKNFNCIDMNVLKNYRKDIDIENNINDLINFNYQNNIKNNININEKNDNLNENKDFIINSFISLEDEELKLYYKKEKNDNGEEKYNNNLENFLEDKFDINEEIKNMEFLKQIN
jgi:hypothetical protein